MSEYQYYEFRAIDKPLDERAQDDLHGISSRTNITATSFTNTYNWGSAGWPFPHPRWGAVRRPLGPPCSISSTDSSASRPSPLGGRDGTVCWMGDSSTSGSSGTCPHSTPSTPTTSFPTPLVTVTQLRGKKKKALRTEKVAVQLLGKPLEPQMVVLGTMSLGGNIVPVENLAESLQVVADAGTPALRTPEPRLHSK
jgi:hypothetical protein